MESLGEIKHIEINKNVCYVLYHNYFSAILAHEIFTEIVTKEEKNISIRLIQNESDKDKETLEKQKNEFSELANKYLDFSKWDMNNEFEKENSEFFCSQTDFGNKNFTKKGKYI